jgi:hypothetical protein
MTQAVGYAISFSLNIVNTYLIFAILMDVTLCFSTVVTIYMITKGVEHVFIALGHLSFFI